MSRKIYWGLVILIVLIGAAVVILLLQPDPELEVIYNDVEPAWTPQPPPADPGFKWVWHENHWDKVPVAQAGEHPPDPIETSSSDWTPPAVKIPADIKDPAVAAAWKRLDDISKNRYQWGQFSSRALELMDELTPMWEPSGDPGDHGEDLMYTLELLCELRDPRSAELLLMYQIDSYVNGRPIDEALVAMGPASVPALVARLDDPPGETFLATPHDLLPQIVAAHRSELGGIVEHIIIPKMETLAASEATDGNAEVNKIFARNALEKIHQKPKN